MSTIQTKFIVVSLPRTGTKSLLQMAKFMGLEISHAPGPAFEGFLGRADIIADTPAFRPSIIQDVVETYPEVKFIYIQKLALEWVASMKKVGLSNNYNNMYNQFVNDPASLSPHNMADLESLMEVLDGEFSDSRGVQMFRKHRRDIRSIIPADRLLMYKFNQGWESLAEFLGTQAPNVSVPHMNQDTMFDNFTD